MEHYPVVIVGGGPAGSAAALYLSRRNIKTALVEKALFPRDKACGDGIPLKTFRLLEELGFSERELFKQGYAVGGMNIWGPDEQQLNVGDASAAGGKSGCIPRKFFDEQLFRKAAGAVDCVLEGWRLVKIESRASDRLLYLKGRADGRERQISASLIIGADGAQSHTARYLGLRPLPEAHVFEGVRRYYSGKSFGRAGQIFYDKRLLPGYFWIFPVGEDAANVGLMRRRTNEKVSRGLQNLFEELIRENVQIRQALAGAQAQGAYRGAALPLGSLPGKRVGEGVLLIGDAAAFIHPVTGGGIYWAILSARLAAGVAVRAVKNNDFSSAGLSLYEKQWKKEIYPAFKASLFLQKRLSSEASAGKLFDAAEHKRYWRNLFFALYGRPLPRFALWHPLFWLRILRG